MFFLHVWKLNPHTHLAYQSWQDKSIWKNWKVSEKFVWKHFICLGLQIACCSLKLKASKIDNIVLYGTSLIRVANPWWKLYILLYTAQLIRGHIHIQVTTQNFNLTLYFLPNLPPPITSSVAIEKYVPNKSLNLTDEDTPAMSPHVDKKLLRLRSFKSRKLF